VIDGVTLPLILAVEAAAVAIAIGVVSNTTIKVTVAVALSRDAFMVVEAGPAAIAAVLVATLRGTHGL
jgi:hypothetical protein